MGNLLDGFSFSTVTTSAGQLLGATFMKDFIQGVMAIVVVGAVLMTLKLVIFK